MNCKEINNQYLSLFHEGAYDPQSAESVDFIDEHSLGIRSNSISTATTAIVLPAHNEERLLPRCLASINQALLVNNEQANVIVVDNRSTDATGEIAKYFGATVVYEPKKGIGQARQTGLMATDVSNELILTTDSDSVIPKNWIESHREVLDDPLVCFSWGAIRLIVDQKIPWSRKLGFYSYLVGRKIVRSLKSHLSSNYVPVNGGNSAFRREDALSIGGYRTHLAAMEDYYIMLDLVEKTHKKASKANTTVLASARRIAQSGFVKMAKLRIEDNIGILSDRPGEPETYEDFRQA